MSDSRTSLLAAIETNDVEAVKQLLQRGGAKFVNDDDDDEDDDDDSVSPLWLSILMDHRTITDLLLEAGADVNKPFNANQTRFKYKGATRLLHLAIKNQDKYLMQKLVSAGARTNACNNEGESPLQLAITTGCDTWIIRLLLDFGASTSHVGKDGNTLLHHACRAGNAEWTSLLLTHQTASCNVNAKNLAGLSALLMAVARKHADVVETLLTHGANPRERLELNKATMLHVACEVGDPRIIQLLLEYGADANARDRYERTAWMTIEDGNLEAAGVMVRYYTKLFRNDPFLQDERVWEWIMLNVPLRKLYLYYLFHED